MADVPIYENVIIRLRSPLNIMPSVYSTLGPTPLLDSESILRHQMNQQYKNRIKELEKQLEEAESLYRPQAMQIVTLQVQLDKARKELGEIRTELMQCRNDLRCWIDKAPREAPPYVSVHTRVTQKIKEAYDEADQENQELRAMLLKQEEIIAHLERERGVSHL